MNPPLTDDAGHQITPAVTDVAWTADPGGGLGPGEYQAFSISAGPLPRNASSLTFPALQGYDDGTTWAGSTRPWPASWSRSTRRRPSPPRPVRAPLGIRRPPPPGR